MSDRNLLNKVSDIKQSIEMSFISVIQIYSAHPLYQSYCSFMCRPIQLSKIVPFYSEEFKSICFQYPLTTIWDEPPDETAKNRGHMLQHARHDKDPSLFHDCKSRVYDFAVLRRLWRCLCLNVIFSSGMKTMYYNI